MRRAICIGFGDFDDREIPTLPGAEHDARAFFDRITDKDLGAADRSTSQLLLSPTRRSVRESLSAFRSTVEPGDQCILYIAGHATHLSSGKLAIDCRDTRSDARSLTALVEDELRRHIASLRSARHLVILDTCFSGTFRAELSARSKGDESPAMQRPSGDGVTYVWASGPRELAFEGEGRGLFTGLLLQAIECGAGVPSHKFEVSASDVVDWIKTALAKTTYPKQFWPGVASSGNVERLYLSRNPFFNSAGDANEAGVRTLQSQIEAIERRMSSTPAEKRERLIRQAKELSARGRLPKEARAGIIWFSPRRGLLKFLGHLLFLPVGIWLAGEMFGPIAAWITGAIVGLFFVWQGLELYELTRNRRQNFILANPDGFLIAKKGFSESSMDAVAWSEVVAINLRERTNSNNVHSVKLVVRLDSGREIVFDKNDFDHTGQPLEIREFLAKNLALSNAVAPGRNPDEEVEPRLENGARAIEQFLLAGVADYQHLAALTSPALDVELLENALSTMEVDSVVVSKDASLDAFEVVLLDFLRNCAGKDVGIYFSGHGIQVPGDLALCFTTTHPDDLERSALLVSRLPDLIHECRVRHLLLILDCCFSGGAGAVAGRTLESAGKLKELFGPHGEALTVFASVDADSESFSVRGQPSFFTAALAAALSDMQNKETQESVLALGERTAAKMNEMGLSPLLQFTSTASSSIAISGQTFDPLLEYAESASDQMNAILQKTALICTEFAKKGDAGKITTTGGDFVGELFIRPPIKAGFDSGCAVLLAIPAFLFLMLGLAAGDFVGAVMVVMLAAGIATVVGALTGPKGQHAGFIFIARQGLILEDGTTIPWLDVADIKAVEHTFSMEGSEPRHDTSIVLVDRHGGTRVLCDTRETWSSRISSIHARIDELRNGW